jgi:hypothetical protein
VVTPTERLRARFPELEERPSQFHGEPALWLEGREIFHTHGPEEVEIRLTRKRIARRDHEGFWQRTPSSDWVGLPAADLELAAELLAEAIEASSRTD